MINHLKTEDWALLTCLLCGALLCTALFMEYFLGLAPCPLCMMQRIWLALVGLVAYLGLCHNPRWGIYPLVCGLCAVIGAAFSVRQLWLQSLPPEQAPSCGAPMSFLIETGNFGQLLTAMTSGTGDCASVSWSMLGLSIPGWLLLFFIMLAGCCVMQLRRGLG